ncbi:hypothetical protein [Chryseobacterium sp. YR221]|uniref:hypothetical protein n=1 Tax=Chryseobacterium sp. YR221 TaxID=1500293 RepID=UPI0009D7E8C4|nr:hypothetical protein [Chryseobacterium sp. YR221]SMC34853.1 hypothetical protein SAMN02787074_0520 [Chryseobacterium sp. YR221]
MKEFLNFLKKSKILQFVKEYLPFFIIIPPSLGGIKQIFQISMHSPNLVSKCFSVSQVVLDGILILLNMPFMLFGLLLYYLFRNYPEKKYKIGIILLIIVVLTVYAYLYYITNDSSGLIQLILYLVLNGAFILCYHYQKKLLTQKYGKVAYITFIALLFSFLNNIISIGSELHIYNFRVLIDKVRLKHSQAMFLYSNEKCILFDLNPKEGDYLIIKYEDIYFDNSVTESEEKKATTDSTVVDRTYKK